MGWSWPRGHAGRWQQAARAPAGGRRQPLFGNPSHARHRRADARLRQVDAGLPHAGRARSPPHCVGVVRLWPHHGIAAAQRGPGIGGDHAAAAADRGTAGDGRGGVR
ncbi:hypothetical protein G6F35_017248 [Rhizopus arrhizus]|nr:hypothetical protein G6F35_017248 [Rhizopus arrhizus]